jgi:hypothetical protein
VLFVLFAESAGAGSVWISPVGDTSVGDTSASGLRPRRSRFVFFLATNVLLE